MKWKLTSSLDGRCSCKKKTKQKKIWCQGISVWRNWRNFNLCAGRMATLTKCRNRRFFPSFRNTIFFHFNLNVVFHLLFFLLPFDCERVGCLTGCFYLIAYTNEIRKYHGNVMIFASIFCVLIFHFICAFVGYFAVLAYFFRAFVFRWFFVFFLCCYIFLSFRIQWWGETFLYCLISFLACVAGMQIIITPQLYCY